jgi:hypothetical protein
MQQVGETYVIPDEGCPIGALPTPDGRDETVFAPCQKDCPGFRLRMLGEFVLGEPTCPFGDPTLEENDDPTFA